MKTPSQMVDDILTQDQYDWIPPVPRYVEPPLTPLSGYSAEYQLLLKHHQLETDTLLAAIREMRRRLLTTT